MDLGVLFMVRKLRSWCDGVINAMSSYVQTIFMYMLIRNVQWFYDCRGVGCICTWITLFIALKWDTLWNLSFSKVVLLKCST
jgi:hypothetical protein